MRNFDTSFLHFNQNFRVFIHDNAVFKKLWDMKFLLSNFHRDISTRATRNFDIKCEILTLNHEISTSVDSEQTK